jgi:hypothetical protein
LLGILLLAGFRVPLFCQPCLQKGITFYSQQQIDSFQINFPACTEIEGDVTIDDGFPVNNITNLNGLNALTSIDGNLTIRNMDLLPDLSGLYNLVSIGGSLWIYPAILFFTIRCLFASVQSLIHSITHSLWPTVY